MIKFYVTVRHGLCIKIRKGVFVMKDHRNEGAYCERKRGFLVPCFYCNVLTLLLLALLVTCAPAWAADVVYTVTKRGDELNDDITYYTTDPGATTLDTLSNLLTTVKSGDIVSVIDNKTYVLKTILVLDKPVKLKAEAGAILLNNTMHAVIIHCKVAGATADDTQIVGFTLKGANGGLKITNGSPLVKDCTFSDSTAAVAMDITAGSPTVDGCTFKKNKKGAMSIAGSGTTTVKSCLFSGNQADNGGGMYVSAGTPTVRNCIFVANTAIADGGGMYVAGGNPAVVNCTFSSNQATNGGGMYVAAGATPVVVNTILWGNTATKDPNIGVLMLSSTVPTVTLQNCVLPAEEVDEYVLIGKNCVHIDPKLVSCDADGHTPATSADIRYYKLPSGSSAIGRGLPVGTKVATVGGVNVVVPDKDQLGNPRIHAPDIGAWESGEPDPAPTPGSGPASGPASGPDAPTSANPLGATLTLTSGGTVSGDRLLVDVPSGGSLAVTLRVTDWKDPRGNPVTPYQVRALVGGVERKMTQLDAETFVLTLTPADLEKPLVLQGHIAGDQWITSQGLTVAQTDTVLPTPTPTPDPTPTPSDPTPAPTPAEPTTPDTTTESGQSSGGGCQAASFAQCLLALAALALLKRK